MIRHISGVLSVVLPLTPFVIYATEMDYPAIIIYVSITVTVAMGLIGLARGKGVGAAGLFSAFSSMVLLMLAMGYVPVVTGFTLGIVNAAALKWLGLSIGLSIYAYFLGVIYESSSRIARRMVELGYGDESFKELDAANAVVIIMGAALLAISFAALLFMESADILSLNPLISIMIFAIIYLAAMMIARIRGGDGE